MTCIIGLEHNGKVYIGGDSAGVAGYSRTVVANPKVFRVGEMICGYTTSFRMGQLLQYHLNVVLQPPRTDDLRYLVTSVVPAIRTAFRDGGYLEKHHEAESGGTFLLGYRHRLYSVEGEFHVLRSAGDFLAVGCGEQVALGAMEALGKIDPVRRIRKALAVVAKYNIAVAPPFRVVRL